MTYLNNRLWDLVKQVEMAGGTADNETSSSSDGSDMAEDDENIAEVEARIAILQTQV